MTDTQADGRKENAALETFDPGAAPATADAEAGGGPAQPQAARAANNPPAGRQDPSSPAKPGVRLPPVFWMGAAAVGILVLLVAGVASF